jgi:xanthine dehydrogenase small subunit
LYLKQLKYVAIAGLIKSLAQCRHPCRHPSGRSKVYDINARSPPIRFYMPMHQGLSTQLTFTLNGVTVSLSDIAPTMTLLDYLHHSGRTGTKLGCGDGDCGACTVAMISQSAHGAPHYQAINSCLMPLGAVAGRDIVTVEGIGTEHLHPVQTAMVATGGSQCGYCTPGFIMSMFAAYYDGQLDDRCVEGNLCRCTGYLAIRRAAEQVALEAADDRFRQRIASAQLPTHLPEFAYQTAAQQFYRPLALTDVFALWQHHPTAQLVAGATDLGLDMSHHRQPFPVLITLEAVAELQQLTVTPESVEIGAAVPLSHLEQTLPGIFPSLDEMLHWFAARQVRNRATLGGNLGTASPIGDLPPVLLALDAELRLVSAAGERIMAVADFFTGYRKTRLQPQEVIATIRIPRLLTTSAVQRWSQSYKIGKRGTDDISIVAAAFTVDLDANHHVVHARLAYGGVAATPIRAVAVEQFLLGKPWNIVTIQQAKSLLHQAFTPLTDLRGSADYRKRLVANLFEKFFVEFGSGYPVEVHE